MTYLRFLKIFYILYCCSAWAHATETDSLRLLKGENKASYLYRKVIDPSDYVSYQKTLDLLRAEAYRGKYITLIHISRALTFYDSRTDSCDHYLKKAEAHGYTDNYIVKFQLNRCYGLRWAHTPEIEKSFEYFLQNIQLARKHNDMSSLEIGYSDLAIPHYYLQNYQEAINYWLQAANSAHSIKSYNRMFAFYQNIGLTYANLNQNDSARKYYNHCISLQNRYQLEVDQANLLLNMGVLEFKMKEYNSALTYFKKSASLSLEVNDMDTYARSISNVASVYNETNRSSEGVMYLKNAISIARRSNNNNLLYSLHHTMSSTLRLTGDYQLALAHLDSSYVLKDSILNETRIETILKLEEAYKSAEKDALIAEAEAESARQKLKNEEAENARKRQKQITLFLIMGLFMMFVVIFLVFRSYQAKKRSSKLFEEQNKIIQQKNKDVTDSIQYAKNLQESILPKPNVIARNLPKYMIFFKPRDIVSGDFFWFAEEENNLFLAAADCTGHGVPGAFVSMMCYNLLNSSVKEKKLVVPGEILSDVNKRLNTEFKNEYSQFQANDGMDISLICLNKTSGILKFAGAMNDIIQFSENNATIHKANRAAIGGSTCSDFQFATKEIYTSEGDIFYMFSDGYCDQFGGPKKKKFLKQNLITLLQSIKDHKPDVQVSILDKTLLEWQGNIQQIDDILIIGFQIV